MIGDFLKLFGAAQLRQWGELTNSAKSGVAGGEMRCGEPTAGETGDRNLLRRRQFLLNHEVESGESALKEGIENGESLVDVFRPNGKSAGRIKAVFVSRQGQGKAADPAVGEELDRLVERVFAEGIGS